MSRHRDDGDGRCVLSDLPVESCAGCQGHTDPVVDLLLNEGDRSDRPDWKTGEGDATVPAAAAHAISAKYPGQCTAWPGCEIRRGDSIIPTRAGTWMHDPCCPGGKR